MSSLRKILAAAALLAASSSAAHAADLFTPPVDGIAGTIHCEILNVSKKPIKVSATARDATSSIGGLGVDITGVSNCPVPPATLPAGLFCVSISQLLTSGDVSYCHFTASGSKVRAVLYGRATAGNVLLHQIPATKK